MKAGDDGRDVVWGGVGSFRRINTSIFLFSFVLFLTVSQGHAHTCANFSPFLLHAKMCGFHLFYDRQIILLVISTVSSPHATNYNGADFLSNPVLHLLFIPALY